MNLREPLVFLSRPLRHPEKEKKRFRPIASGLFGIRRFHSPVKLIGSEGILTGIGADVAQTHFKLGVYVSNPVSLQSNRGFNYASKKTGVETGAE